MPESYNSIVIANAHPAGPSPDPNAAAAAPQPSKTRRKREMHALQELGERLAELQPAQLARIAPLSDALRAALDAARTLTRFEARRRQLQYIGRLMREIDPAPVREALARVQGRSNAAIALQHETERQRERLLEDPAALAAFAADHPGADVQRLRALVRRALAERQRNAPPRSYRELFRALREIIDEGVES